MIFLLNYTEHLRKSKKIHWRKLTKTEWGEFPESADESVPCRGRTCPEVRDPDPKPLWTFRIFWGTSLIFLSLFFWISLLFSLQGILFERFSPSFRGILGVRQRVLSVFPLLSEGFEGCGREKKSLLFAVVFLAFPEKARKGRSGFLGVRVGGSQAPLGRPASRQKLTPSGVNGQIVLK